MEEIYKQSHEAIKIQSELIDWYQAKLERLESEISRLKGSS